MNQEIYDNSDTICAISTPGGVGGIAVIRVSGADAVPVVSKIWKGAKIDLFKSHTAPLRQLCDPESGDVIEEGLHTNFRAPHAFTGETVIDLGVHGST
ncbi:MAG: tRNA uridine-5-carboxymethylaminomethyl(34) synthesis GTPase MnmE, partial [Muribaculaceae bacterium]|nr:tRNA uridine-5-carboxymethylaminomethyl(34) synthesis GTPase MnmE [Muribaculaceae bacterium]